MTLTTKQLQQELAKRERAVRTLQGRRVRLVGCIRKLEDQIREHGGTVRIAGKRTRAKNEVQLLDALKAVLKGKTMGVSEVAEAVQKAGYVTTSPNFRTIVNQTLLKKKHFTRVSRGQYTAKSA